TLRQYFSAIVVELTRSPAHPLTRSPAGEGMHLAPVKSSARRRHARGQSLAEFVITLPIMLLLTMIAIDFGRVYLGWINLPNMTRIAANFAANHPTSWTGVGNAADQTLYRNLILNDAKATNCTLPVAGGQP